ncbi:hypothetical protein C211_23350 [Stutzerimonas degradans]|nr:hypothetical protein C211_23350 [Stutzerimonas degradans]
MHLGKSCGCHQISSRSFFYKNYQFPICARCTGILIGQFIIAPMCLFFGFNHLILNVIFVGIMAIDGIVQYIKLLQSNNIRRLITGLLGGFAIMSLTVYLSTIVWNVILDFIP